MKFRFWRRQWSAAVQRRFHGDADVHEQHPYTPLTDMRPELVNEAPCVTAIIDQVLVKNPDDRYQRARQWPPVCAPA